MRRPALVITLTAVLLAVIGMTGYGFRHADGPDGAPTETPRAHSYDITFQRSACFGECPDFVMRIDPAGNVKLHVPASEGAPSDERHPGIMISGTSLSPARYAALARRFDTDGFRELKRNYSINVTDGPTTTITLDSPHGHWSTEVYMVPCVMEVGPRDPETLRQMGITEFVPNIFCDLAAELDEIACDAYLSKKGLNPSDDMNPFRPSHCRRPR